MPPSAATTRSSSVIALAIHVTSWCSTRPRSAVTSPPPPRRSMRAPSVVAVVGDRPAVRDDDQLRAGRTSHDRDRSLAPGVVAGQEVEEHEPVAQQARRQEVPANVLLALSARARASAGSRRISMHAWAHSSTESTSQPVSPSSIWATIPPTRPATVGRALPERLGHRQAEALLRIDFWISASRVHLERVHLDRADVVHVAQDVDVRIAVGVLDGAVVVVPAFRVVVRHRADERELHLGKLLLHRAVGVDHAERVLPRIEARDLRQQRPLDVDAELVDDVRGVLGRERHVLRLQRVDRRRPDARSRQARRRAARTRAGGRSPRRSGAATAAARRTRPGSASRSRCGRARSTSPAARGNASIIAAGCGSWTIT